MKLLVALAVLGGLATITPVILFCLVRWRLRAQLRIRPGTPSAAPTAWLLPWGGAACLHRRLRRLAALARAASGGDPLLVPVAKGIEDQALVLEAHLVAIARAGRPAVPARRALGARIARLEGLAVSLAADPPTLGVRGPRPDPVGELADRLDALRAARAEVRLIDAHSA